MWLALFCQAPVCPSAAPTTQQTASFKLLAWRPPSFCSPWPRQPRRGRADANICGVGGGLCALAILHIHPVQNHDPPSTRFVHDTAHPTRSKPLEQHCLAIMPFGTARSFGLVSPLLLLTKTLAPPHQQHPCEHNSDGGSAGLGHRVQRCQSTQQIDRCQPPKMASALHMV